MENIPLYIERKHGRVPVSYPHEDLADILKDTYGVIVYQEQIMMIASRMAGFRLEKPTFAKGGRQKQGNSRYREKSFY